MLLKLMLDGAFLVRSGERVQNSFAITFMADKKGKHCLIKKEGRLFLIGTAQFETLVDLVAYYEKNPLYKKVKLKSPVTCRLAWLESPGTPGMEVRATWTPPSSPARPAPGRCTSTRQPVLPPSQSRRRAGLSTVTLR